MIGPFRRRAHFERDYISHVAKLLKQHSREEAMSLAVGGSVGESGFEEIGRAQVEGLIGAGLIDGMSLVDLGCGSGRTAVQIARRLPGVQYLGLDVVPALLAHARSICPANYRFVRSAALGFPVPDESVDMVFAFSVFASPPRRELRLPARRSPDPSARRPNDFLIPRVCQPGNVAYLRLHGRRPCGRKSSSHEYLYRAAGRCTMGRKARVSPRGCSQWRRPDARYLREAKMNAHIGAGICE